MKPCSLVGVRLCVLGCCLLWTHFSRAAESPQLVEVVEARDVEVSTDGTRWVPIREGTKLRAQDKVRTGRNGRAALRWTDSSIVPFGSMTAIEIVPPQKAETSFSLRLLKGVLSFFHRDKPGSMRALTPAGVAGIEGTEFVIAVDDNNQTTVWVIDGKVTFTNEFGPPLVLTNGDQAMATVGRAPQRIVAGFVVNHVLQWAFYYPAVLDLRDVAFSAEEQRNLADSLTEYRKGDLLAALDKLGTRDPGSEAEQIYYAALLLSVGEVARAEAVLTRINQAAASEQHRRDAVALQQLISTVRHENFSGNRSPESATELLAASYYEQSLASGDATLMRALSLARRATTNSPEFSFAWARVAELEFSFGNTRAANQAVTRSLSIAPRNAQALALKGFLTAAENKTRDALDWFERALEVDRALGNAWLGRGLVRIRRGDLSGGREDLLIAAAIEPRRAQLRSYLGKAYADDGKIKLALHELDLAKEIDPKDPTAWLYSALAKADQNRINEAIRDLEQAQQLNDNRSVFRSRFLLDQDRAMESVNLARIYSDADMNEVAQREASRAVAFDYTSYSAHYFLANSYNQLRDPSRVNLRYESAALVEYFIANLLAPSSAGILSPVISQQEYSRFFERRSFGWYSGTEYLSRGDWTESGAHYGTIENLSYDVETFYHTRNGDYANNDLEERQISAIAHQQLTLQDSVYFQIVDYELSGGDLAQYYDPQNVNRAFRFDERQRPDLFLGFHHEWDKGTHTLLFGARQTDFLAVTDRRSAGLLVGKAEGIIGGVRPVGMRQLYRNETEVYTAEGQQIWERDSFHTVVGARHQNGEFDTGARLHHPTELAGVFQVPPSLQSIPTDFQRTSVYAYHTWDVFQPLRLTVGLTYDYLKFPENHRIAPVSAKEEHLDQFSPKAGGVWTFSSNSTVRAIYSQSISGASVEQSIQIEPSQIAGFEQTFRSLIPESVAGANTGARFEVYGVAFDQKFSSGTYVGLTALNLESELHRTVGAFDLNPDVNDFALPSGLKEHLNYYERAASVSIDQLLGDEWSIGGRYRFAWTQLEDTFVRVPPTAFTFPGFARDQELTAISHQVELHGIFNHRSGAYGKIQLLWIFQNSAGYRPQLQSEDVFQLNVFAGYRFWRRRIDAQLGLMNLTDEDYHLNPLSAYQELPRGRTFVARLQLSF